MATDVLKLQRISKALATVQTLPPNIASLMLMASKQEVTPADLAKRFKVKQSEETTPLLVEIAKVLNESADRAADDNKGGEGDDRAVLQGLENLFGLLNNAHATFPPPVLHLIQSIRAEHVTPESLAKKLRAPCNDNTRPMLAKISELMNEQRGE